MPKKSAAKNNTNPFLEFVLFPNGGRRGIRLTAIADRECRGHNRVQPGYAAVRHYSGVLPSPDKQKGQRVLPFYGGRRGIRLTAIADRECQGHNRVQPGYAAVRHYPGVLPSPINKKGNGCCLFMAEGEGFALQRLPIGNAKGTIACSPDMPRCGIIRGFCPRR